MHSRTRVDKVRASRDGHEYHEVWTARKALQLLWPYTDLVAIAVEGLSPADQASASAQTIEIADIVLYYGGRPTFETASRTSFAQFKYSVAEKDKDFRASHAKKTIQKFGATYREYKKKYGTSAVQEKLDFQLITNQPIYEPLLLAIDSKMKREIRIAIIGDFEFDRSSHKATNEALRHAADALLLSVGADWVPTQTLETEVGRIKLEEYHAVFCAPGGPYRSMTGALEAIRFARERGWPFFGT